MKKHYEIRITGIVQGVGFRPFIYSLAVSHELTGKVLNDTEGVIIYIDGNDEQLRDFINDIYSQAPPLSSIKNISFKESEGTHHIDFKIEESGNTGRRFTFMPPDTALCGPCLDELLDSKDRRHNYPFITCTNCGPRFSIIKDIPYDRKNTSMEGFKMCSPCEREYLTPQDRRFHTQPNACPVCGPHLSLYDRQGTLITESRDTLAAKIVELLMKGKILAIKGTGGYHIACDARNDNAVLELRKRKGRPFKPFALMAGSIDSIKEFLNISEKEKEMLLSKERPIIILKESKPLISRYAAPSISYQGVMLPYMPIHHLLFSINSSMILVMTSGNLSDDPIIFKDKEAFKSLGRIADYLVTYNREIIAQSDDSILFVENDSPFFIRRSRGYVPAPFYSSKTRRHILALGGDLKNSFAIAREDFIILSQYLGDLATPEGNELFKDTLEHFKKVYDFSPEIIVSDMHPGYFTSLLAESLEEEGLKSIKIQHHHAHIASVLEEQGLDEPVIGISFDGTGYGTDGSLWGSEFIIADKKSFKRAAHFSAFRLPGGESAIRDVWKIGLSLLYSSYGDNIPVMERSHETENVLEIIRKGINSPLTCSIGRIFDGISAILGLSRSISAEAEAAILLEERGLQCAQTGMPVPFEIPFIEKETIVLQTDALTDYIVSLIKNGESKENTAYAFHSAIGCSTVKISEMLKERYGINKIALSGGVFQNRLLLNMIINGLRGKGFDIYTPCRVPLNDGCIALGQIAAAKEILKNE